MNNCILSDLSRPKNKTDTRTDGRTDTRKHKIRAIPRVTPDVALLLLVWFSYYPGTPAGRNSGVTQKVILRDDQISLGLIRLKNHATYEFGVYMP